MSDHAMTTGALEDLVVLAAMRGDSTGLHRAVAATLDRHPRGRAYARVFAPALDRLAGPPWERARAVMNEHLLQSRRTQHGTAGVPAGTDRLAA